jgi:hypothetical protein
MKRIFVVLALVIFAAFAIAFPERYAAQAASSGPTPDAFETVKEFLIASAAKDFNEHQPPFPAQFRNVRIGHVGDTDKSGSYRMCGEFLPSEKGDKAEWIAFATIKTSGYEQYIGSDISYCNSAKLVWDTTDDLSSTLKTRLDSIKKKK